MKLGNEQMEELTSNFMLLFQPSPSHHDPTRCDPAVTHQHNVSTFYATNVPYPNSIAGRWIMLKLYELSTLLLESDSN